MRCRWSWYWYWLNRHEFVIGFLRPLDRGRSTSTSLSKCLLDHGRKIAFSLQAQRSPDSGGRRRKTQGPIQTHARTGAAPTDVNLRRITLRAAAEVLRYLGYPTDLNLQQKLISEIDVDKTGEVGMEEFLKILYDACFPIFNSYLWEERPSWDAFYARYEPYI